MRDIRAAVISHDAAKVRDIVDSKIFDIKGRRAMSIYATSFSDNYLSERSRGLIKCVEGFFKEVRLVAEGVDMSDHYEKAVHFLNVYYRGARLPMEELDGLQL